MNTSSFYSESIVAEKITFVHLQAASGTETITVAN